MENVIIHNSFDTPAKEILRKGVTEDDLVPVKSSGQRFKEAFSKKGFKKFLRNNFPAKGDRAKDVIRKLIMDISFVVLLGSLVYLGIYYIHYREKVSDTSELLKYMEEYENTKDLEAAWASIKAEYPDVDFPEGMDISFARLYAINSDVVGRILIPGTNIDSVMVQTTNNSYYLYKDFYGKESRYGMPFANCNCDMTKTGLSTNTIIYGHNTHDGLMFHQLLNYMTVEGYQDSPVIELDTLYEKTYWKVFGVILTNATSDLDNGNVFNCLYAEYDSVDEYQDILNGIATRTIISTGVDVNTSDKIMSLYTCYQNIFKGGRLIVFARQVRSGESTDVDTTAAALNSSARYPQAYYDAKGLVNPYYSSTAQQSTGSNITAEGDVLFG